MYANPYYSYMLVTVTIYKRTLVTVTLTTGVIGFILTRYRDSVRVFLTGRGKDRNMKGSKVLDT